MSYLAIMPYGAGRTGPTRGPSFTTTHPLALASAILGRIPPVPLPVS
jgi:hypothetical protein